MHQPAVGGVFNYPCYYYEARGQRRRITALSSPFMEVARWLAARIVNAS